MVVEDLIEVVRLVRKNFFKFSGLVVGLLIGTRSFLKIRYLEGLEKAFTGNDKKYPHNKAAEFLGHALKC